MPRQIIFTKEAPAPIGPYSQAVKANGFLFVSGQVAIDAVTNNIVSGNIEAETKQVMQNIHAVLKEAHLSFQHVIKATIFLSDMSLFAQVNEIYATYFDGDFPARETVAVKELPKKVNVEISVTAVFDL